MPLPALRPQPLVRVPEPFNDPAWLWELKPDGFRALAYVEAGACRLVSRRGHTYRSFDSLRADLAGGLRVKDAILDGEIVCLDAEGVAVQSARHPVRLVAGDHCLAPDAPHRKCRLTKARPDPDFR